LSARPELGQDLTELFNYLTGCGRPQSYRKLLVAPVTLRPRLLEEIRREAESGDGRIAIKVNNLSDETIIEALYAASAAGTEIDLAVRAICCLRPGVPGLSDRIRVRSVLGRFLEHSRVYRFGKPGRNARYYIGSADLMNRNLDKRVETLAQVDDPALQARLEELLEVNFAPNALAWTLAPDGVWSKRESATPTSHERFQRLAKERSLANPA
jgi:polyphosphate kinase